MGGFYRQLAGITACWLRVEVDELDVRPQLLGEEDLATPGGLFHCLDDEAAPCEAQG